jgi:hypothetical protein
VLPLLENALTDTSSAIRARKLLKAINPAAPPLSS